MLKLARSKQGKMLIPVLIGVVVAGAAAGTLLFGKLGSAKKHDDPEKAAPKHLIKIEEMVVNLADSREPHYLKTSLALEVRGADVEHEAEKLMPKIRDACISVISTQFYYDLLVPKNRERLKEAIRKRVDEIMEGSEVVSVYFTDFAMQ